MRRILNFLLLMAILLAVLYGLNLIIYTAVVAAFNITLATVLTWFGVLLGVLSLSFIAATIVGTHYYNWFSRWYYRIAATWVGVGLYMCLASIVYGLVVAIVGLPLQWLGALLLSTAIVAGVYGFVHARDIKVKEVRITLPNLPAVWRGRRVIWTSDIHLGQLYGPKFARRVVSLINSLPHDIVCIGGDLYDGTGAPDIEELAKPLGQCKAPLGIYYVAGNHEEYGETERFMAAIRAAGIRVLMDEMVSIDGVQIIGVDYKTTTNATQFRDILARLSIDRTRPSILLKHEPSNLSIAQQAGISLSISGHTHQGQLWPFEYVAQWSYKGFAYGLKKLGEMQVFVSSGTGTWGPPMRVGTDGEIIVFVFE